MTENKTIPTGASVADFIDAVEPPRRQAEAITLLALFQRVTQAPATMWGPSIIGFGQYDYVTAAGRKGIMLATGFSPRKARLSLYVGNKFDGAEALYAGLGKFKRSVACLYINKLADVDMAVLEAIIRADYQYRCAKSGV